MTKENTENTDTQIASALRAVAARESVTDIYFVGCGGSYALMLANQYTVEREANQINGIALNSAEFKARAPKRLGKSSVVILCSHSGATPETVEAAAIAHKSGALTIALTHVPGSALNQASEYTVSYTHAPMTMSSAHSAAILSRLTFGILKARERNNKAGDLDKALAVLPTIVDRAIEERRAVITEFAESHKREPVIYTMGSGPNFGIAYSHAICIFQEMQWIHSAAIHAGEYFHGPFEITDFDVPFIQLIGVGPSRTIDERAFSFVRKCSKRVTSLDARDLGASELPQSIAEHVTPLIFLPVLRAYSEKLAEAKGHPLTVRRYMWKMEY